MYCYIRTEWLCNLFVYFLLQVKHHKDMVCNGGRYWIKKLDETKKTSYSRVSSVFEVTNVSSRTEKHPEVSENQYYGYLEDIIQCDFKSFKVVLFVVKWYRLRLNQRDPDRNIIKHDNLPWLIQGFFSQEQSPMFFQANVNMYFTLRFQVEGVGHLL